MDTEMINEAIRISGLTGSRFWLTFSFYLTITGRESYATSSLTVDRPDVLRGINESQHKIMSYVLRKSNSTSSMEASEVLRQILESAQQYSAQAQVVYALALAVRHSNQTDKNSITPAQD